MSTVAVTLRRFCIRSGAFAAERQDVTQLPGHVITTAQTRSTLEEMPTDARFDREHPDPQIVLDVFREFAQIPVACASDLILFQVGSYSFTGPELFELDLTRQFAHEENGQYVGMEQLHCTLYYQPTDELRALKCNLWSAHCSSLAEFFDRVEQLPEFQIPVRSSTPLRADIGQENV